jgi:uncharacterized protein DUF5648
MKRAWLWAALSTACATGGDGDAPVAVTSSGTGQDCAAGSECDGTCVDLANDPTNCGMCGRTCVLQHGQAVCSGGDCALGACDTGYADCNADLADGCELLVTCVDGDACATSCQSQGTLDCADACTPSCVAPAESCNAADDDCNAACDEGPVPGCRVGVHRAYNNALGHFFTTDQAEAAQWGQVEALNFFYLYGAATSDLRPFFRCGKPNGTYFLSTSTDCEMTGGPLLTVGFIAPVAHCDAVPLYRIYHGPNNWHFYTTSLGERDAAIAAGWSDQGIAGYVWGAP